MKRFLIVVIILAAGAMLGGHYYYEQQIAKRLDNAAMMVSGMGGDLEYRDITITLSGEVRVDGLFFQIPGMGGALNVDRLAVHTGGPLGVHRLAMDIRDQQLPKSLGLSFEGVRFPLATEAGMSPVSFSAFTAAGCGNRLGFGTSELVQMGYSGLVMDGRVDYRFVGGGQLLNVVIDTHLRNMHRTEISVELSVGASSLNAAAVAMAAQNAEVLGATIEYQDMGYADRVIEFCQKETGLNQPAYIAQHLEAWQRMWARLGFVAGPTMVEAYGNFLNQPDHLGLSIKPSGDLAMNELAQTPPELLLYHLQTTLSVNHEDVGRLDLAVREEGPLVEPRDTVSSGETPAEPTASARPQSGAASAPADAEAIAIENLSQHLNRDVALHLTDGRRLEGQIQQTSEASLQFKRFQSGGYVILPVQYRDIAAVYLR